MDTQQQFLKVMVLELIYLGNMYNMDNHLVKESSSFLKDVCERFQ